MLSRDMKSWRKTDAVIRKSLLWTATELGTDGASYVIPFCYRITKDEESRNGREG